MLLNADCLRLKMRSQKVVLTNGGSLAGNNIVRLCIYSFPGLVVALAIAFERNSFTKITNRQLTFYVLLLAVISFHHRWSYFGANILEEPVAFALISYVLTCVIGILFYKASLNSKFTGFNKL